MRRRLLVLAGLSVLLSLSLLRSAAAQENGCYEESYGGGSCATTCVWVNDQGSVEGWATTLHPC